jgi:hypothetical protein
LVANVVKNANVRMIQTGNRLRFALEALLASRVRGKMSREDLDSDSTFQSCVPGAINLSHPARAERLNNLIRSELCTWTKRHKWVRL